MLFPEGNLRNPALFTGNEPPAWEMAEQYLNLVDRYPCALSAVRAHMFRLWHHGYDSWKLCELQNIYIEIYVIKLFLLYSCSLCIHTDVRERLSKAGSLSEMKTISNDLKQLAQVQKWN